jgi:hypothetical protein
VEIVHYGRAASRANVGFAAPNVAVGYVRYLRGTGAGRWPLVAYKLLVTADAPVQCAAKAVQAGLRHLRGERAKAAKSWQAACGLAHFLRRDLARFWRA